MAKNQRDKKYTRVNKQIRVPDNEVLVIKDGSKIGVMHVLKAVQIAKDLNLDLVEVAPGAKPPVCIIIDYGKYRYEQSKKEKQNKAHAHKQDIKTVRFRQNTEDHDVETKIKAIRKFLESDKKVQIQVRSKGRELAHKDRGFEIVKKIIEGVEGFGKPDGKPRINGMDVFCRIEPI